MPPRPDHPSIPGVQIAWKYTPCDELAGDFLNYFPLGDKHLAMFVVDVSGHGAASSLLAVTIGRLLTAHASASSLLVRRTESGELAITSPTEVCAELNRRFPMEAQGGLYFTMAYGVLDLETHVFRYASAGHVPMMHLPLGGEPRFLPGDGFAIGFMEENDVDEQTLQLSPGDRVFIYSDGVPEAMSKDLDEFGEDRMLRVIGNSLPRSLSASVEELFESVRAWCRPKGPKDDVSILGLEIGETK